MSGFRERLAAKLAPKQKTSEFDRVNKQINEGNRAGEAKARGILKKAKSGKASLDEIDWVNTHVYPGDPVDETGVRRSQQER